VDGGTSVGMPGTTSRNVRSSAFILAAPEGSDSFRPLCHFRLNLIPPPRPIIIPTSRVSFDSPAGDIPPKLEWLS